jgi:hypothetical protein
VKKEALIMTKREPPARLGVDLASLQAEARTLRAQAARLRAAYADTVRDVVAEPDPITQRRRARDLQRLEIEYDEAEGTARAIEARARAARDTAIEEAMDATRPDLLTAVRAIRDLLVEAQRQSVRLHERIEALAQATGSERPRHEFNMLLFPALMADPGQEAMVTAWLRALASAGWR